MHVVLIGDSIFDNAVYVKPGEPDVTQQLRALLHKTDKVTLLAIDGSVIKTITTQMARIPDDATHLVISIGGNNLLNTFYTIKTTPAASFAEVITRMTQLCADFQQQYHDMLNLIMKRGLPTLLCTVYNPRFPTESEQQFAVTGLRPFNDCILEEVVYFGFPIVELRQICNEDSDYANPIEPSAKGGEKIAQVIKLALETHDFSIKRTQIYK